MTPRQGLSIIGKEDGIIIREPFINYYKSTFVMIKAFEVLSVLRNKDLYHYA